MSTTESELRAAFERWRGPENNGDKLHRSFGRDTYASPVDQWMWEAWQACAAAIQPAASAEPHLVPVPAGRLRAAIGLLEHVGNGRFVSAAIERECVHVTADLERALAGQSEGGAEPVAWKWRYTTPDWGWSLSFHEDPGNSETPVEKIPLYANPPAPQWQPIESAPEEGTFLVFMPTESRENLKIQVARWNPNVKIIGGVFNFDCEPVTHWMPLPAAPGKEG